MEDEQPKDYETFEEFFNDGWNDLTIFQKITYRLQDYVWLAILVGIAGGYLAGTHFGVFW